MNKLRNVSRHLISRLSGRELFVQVLAWTRRYEPELATALEQEEDYAITALEVHRVGTDDSMRLVVLADVRTHLAPFFDAWLPPAEALPFPGNISIEDRERVLQAVQTRYNTSVESDAIFPMVQNIAQELGFAISSKAYKAAPESYLGHVGDVAMVLRVALFGSSRSPDLGKLITALGPERVHRRIRRALRA
jgi:glutamyl-tRNA synthetase